MSLSAPILLIVASTILAYLIGGLPFGYWVVWFTSGKDIRTMGSGNIGATNVHRTQGGKAGATVLALDICKGFFAVFLAARITNEDTLAVPLAAFAVVLGHCYPAFLHFKGGKAVACYVGAFLFLAPVVLLAMLILFVLLVRFSGYVSLASIVCAAVFPLALLTVHPSTALLLACIAASALVIYRHRSNIERLRSGRESAFSLKGGKTA